MTEEIQTWYELKKFCNTLEGGQLGQPVKVWGEGFCHTVTSVEILEEDMINPSGDGAEPVSAYLDDKDYGKEFVEGETKVANQGDIRLTV